jgi:hypothetical protein
LYPLLSFLIIATTSQEIFSSTGQFLIGETISLLANPGRRETTGCHRRTNNKRIVIAKPVRASFALKEKPWALDATSSGSLVVAIAVRDYNQQPIRRRFRKRPTK